MSELSMPLCWNRDSKPHRFCPGCGHGLVLKALGLAVDELEIGDRVTFACDIGCSLLAYDFFRFPSMQTHHGRTIPVMVGLKKQCRKRWSSLIWGWRRVCHRFAAPGQRALRDDPLR